MCLSEHILTDPENVASFQASAAAPDYNTALWTVTLMILTLLQRLAYVPPMMTSEGQMKKSQNMYSGKIG